MDIILAFLCWCAVLAFAATIAYTEHITDRDNYSKSSFNFFCYNHKKMIQYVSLLLLIEGVQLALMFGNSTTPYVIWWDCDGEVISTHWSSSIKDKAIILLVISTIYYIVKFFKREEEYREFQYKEYVIDELRKENAKLENSRSRLSKTLDDNLQKIINSLDKDTHIYVKYFDDNEEIIYRLDNEGGVPISCAGNTLLPEESIPIDLISISLSHGRAYIYDITNEKITE